MYFPPLWFLGFSWFNRRDEVLYMWGLFQLRPPVRFPDRRKDGASFRAWVHFVQVKRKDFFFASVTKYTFVCAAHFRPEDYVSGDMMEFRMGFRSEKRVRLKAGVVPSIHAAPAAASGSATGGSEAHSLSRSLAHPSVRPPSIPPVVVM